MYLPEFDYVSPGSKKEAVDLLHKLGDGAILSVGGTDLIPNMKNGIIRAKTLVSLNRLSPEKETLKDDGSLKIDASSTLSEIAESPLIKEKAPAIAKAAFHVGGQQVRNRGSLGGNLCQEIRCLYLNQNHRFQFTEPCYKRGGDTCYPYPGGKRSCRSVFMSDIAPVLTVLGAQLVILGHRGERVIHIDDFYTGDGLKPLNLDPAEIITSILIPSESLLMKSHFVKATPRGGLEFAMATITIALKIDQPDKKCSKALIAIGSINTKPQRAFKAEKKITGQLLNENIAAEVARETAGEVKILPHHGYSKGYLQQLVEVHTRRSLLALIQTPGEKSRSTI